MGRGNGNKIIGEVTISKKNNNFEKNLRYKTIMKQAIKSPQKNEDKQINLIIERIKTLYKEESDEKKSIKPPKNKSLKLSKSILSPSKKNNSKSLKRKMNSNQPSTSKRRLFNK